MDAKKVLDLKPGVYALREDVTNPQEDRRKKNDWTALGTLKAGFRLYLRSYPANPSYAPEFVVLGKYGNVPSFSPLGKVLVAAMESVTPTVEESLLIRDVWFKDVLIRLVENKTVTLEQVNAVQAILEDEMDKREGR